MTVFLAGVHFFSSFAWSVKNFLQRLDHEVIEFDYRANPFTRIPKVRSFSSIEELKDKSRFYLNNRQEATEIGLRARKKSLKHHTYEHRVRFILAGVLSLDKLS